MAIGVTLVGCASTGSRLPGTAPARCTPGELRLARVFLSPMTGEHGSFFKLVNRSRRGCTLDGYPRVRLYANGVALPFRYVSGGGLYVTRATPRLVTLRPGGTAWFLVAKYRCDLGIIATATSMTVTLPSALTAYTMPAPPQPSLDYCRGGPSDPGQFVTVSPVVLSSASSAEEEPSKTPTA